MLHVRMKHVCIGVSVVCLSVLSWSEAGAAATSSYSPVVIKEDFAATMARMKAAKAEIMQRQMDLLNERYDLSDRPSDVMMSAGRRAVQEGVRVKLPQGVTWK